MKQPTIRPKALIYIRQGVSDLWRDMDDVRRACKGKPVRISGTTLDLMGCQLTGVKLPRSSNSQDEGAAPLRINIEGFTLKRGSVRKFPGGIVFRKPAVSFYDLMFLDVGEDALSNVLDDSPGATVKGCKAWGADDKTWQFNDAHLLTFVSNETYGGRTGVRLQKKGGKNKAPRVMQLRGNLWVNVDTAYHGSGNIRGTITGDDFDNVRLQVLNGNGSKLGILK